MTVSMTELRKKFGYYMSLVENHNQTIIITKYGKQVAAIIPYNLYERLASD